MNPGIVIETHETWLESSAARAATLHSGAHSPLDATCSGGAEQSSRWAPERLFLAALELGICREILARCDRQGIRLVSFSSSALGRVRSEEPTLRWLDIIVSPRMVVATETESDELSRLVRAVEEGSILGLTIMPQVRIRPAIEVAALPISPTPAGQSQQLR